MGSGVAAKLRKQRAATGCYLLRAKGVARRKAKKSKKKIRRGEGEGGRIAASFGRSKHLEGILEKRHGA